MSIKVLILERFYSFIHPVAFSQRVIAVPRVSRMQQLGCIYYFTRTRVLYGRPDEVTS